MITVFHYVGKMDRGGMETLIMNLYRNIDREQVQFHFAVHGDREGDYAEEIYQLGGRFYHFPHMRKNPIAYRKAWREFWKTHGHEYVAFHMHTNSLANIIALEESNKAGVPIRIVHSHSSYANKGELQMLNDFLNKFHRRKVAKIATNLIACSEKAACWLYGGMRLGKHNVVIMNNGIDLKKYTFNEETRVTLRRQLNLEGKKVIGHVGTFLPVKNHRFLLEVVKKAYETDNSVRAVFAGNGALRREMESLAVSLGLSDVVSFLGLRSDVPQLLNAMDVFVMPSFYEGLPVSLVEVQANGLPALVSDTITQELKINDNLEFLPLCVGVDAWGKRAVEILSSDSRVTDTQRINIAEYDIHHTVKMYMSLINHIWR